MPRTSAGLLLYRRAGAGLEVLLVHPGGPLWARKDDGAWSIPKGEYTDGEDPLAAAMRELEEELGAAPALGELVDLGEIRQKGGKVVRAWAAEADLDPETLHSNTFEMEWPPRSGHRQEFPEVDRAAWMTPEQAKIKINPAQAELLERLAAGVR
jgi:predicted NUDIX family NTP pyrophosphohydrolase